MSDSRAVLELASPSAHIPALQMKWKDFTTGVQEYLGKLITDCQETIRNQVETINELKDQHQQEVNLREKAESSAASAKVELSSLHMNLSEANLSIGRITADLEHMAEKAAKAEEESELLKKHLEELKSQLEELQHMAGKAAKAEEESELLKKQLEELKSQLDELQHMAGKAAKAEEESEVLKTQLEELKKQINELEHMACKDTKAELESEQLKTQLENLKRQLDECQFQEESPTDSLVRFLQAALRIYENDVQSRKSRSSHENRELQEVQLNSKKLEAELMLWKSIASRIPGVLCAEDVCIKFENLRTEVIENRTKIAEVNACLKQMEVALEVAEHDKQQTESEVALAKEKADQALSEAKRLEVMLDSVSDERDRLKSELADGSLVQDELEASIFVKESTIEKLENKLSKRETEIKHLNSKVAYMVNTLGVGIGLHQSITQKERRPPKRKAEAAKANKPAGRPKIPG